MDLDTARQLKNSLLRELLSNALGPVEKSAMAHQIGATTVSSRDLKWNRFVPGTPLPVPQVMRDELERLMLEFRASFAPYAKAPAVKNLYSKFKDMVFAWYASDASVSPEDIKGIKNDPEIDPQTKQSLMQVAEFVQDKGIQLLRSGTSNDPKSSKYGNLNDRHLSHYGYAYADIVPVKQGSPSLPVRSTPYGSDSPDPWMGALNDQAKNPKVYGLLFDVIVQRTSTGACGLYARFRTPDRKGDRTIPITDLAGDFDHADPEKYKGLSKFFRNYLEVGKAFVYAPQKERGPIKLVAGRSTAIRKNHENNLHHWNEQYAAGEGEDAWADSEDPAVVKSFDFIRAVIDGANQIVTPRPDAPAGDLMGAIQNALTFVPKLLKGDKKLHAILQQIGTFAPGLNTTDEHQRRHVAQQIAKLGQKAIDEKQLVPGRSRTETHLNKLDKHKGNVFQLKFENEEGGLIAVNNATGETFALSPDQVKFLLHPGEEQGRYLNNGRNPLYKLMEAKQPSDADGQPKLPGYGPWDIAEADKQTLRASLKPLMDQLGDLTLKYRGERANREDYRPHTPQQTYKWVCVVPRFQIAEVLPGGKAKAVIFNRKYVPPKAKGVPQQQEEENEALIAASSAVIKTAIHRMDQPAEGVRNWVVISHDVNVEKNKRVGGRRFPYEAMNGHEMAEHPSATSAVQTVIKSHSGNPTFKGPDIGKVKAADAVFQAAVQEVQQMNVQPDMNTPEMQQEMAEMQRQDGLAVAPQSQPGKNILQPNQQLSLFDQGEPQQPQPSLPPQQPQAPAPQQVAPQQPAPKAQPNDPALFPTASGVAKFLMQKYGI